MKSLRSFMHIKPPFFKISGKRMVLGNTASQIVGKIVGAFASFLTSLIIARAFGVIRYGDFVKITTFVSLFYLLSDFGLNAVYLQEQNEIRKPYVFSTLLSVRFLSAFLYMFFALCIIFFLPEKSSSGYTYFVKMGIVAFAPTILYQAIFQSANAIFQRELRYDLSMISIVAGSALTLVFAWWISCCNSGYLGVLYAVLAVGGGMLLTSLTALYFAEKYEKTPLVCAVDTAKKLIFRALPLGLTLIFNLIYFRVDSIIITLFRSTEEVGIYGLAYKVFEFPLAIPTFFMNAAYPFLIQTRTREGMKVRAFFRIAKLSFISLGALSIFSSFILYVFAPLLIFIRSEFEQSIFPLRILAAGLPLFFFSSVSMWLLITLKAMKALVYIYGAGMVWNIFLNLLFVPRYGYVASAYITILGEACVLLSSLYVLFRLLPQYQKAPPS